MMRWAQAGSSSALAGRHRSSSLASANRSYRLRREAPLISEGMHQLHALLPALESGHPDTARRSRRSRGV